MLIIMVSFFWFGYGVVGLGVGSEVEEVVLLGFEGIFVFFGVLN